MYQAKVQSSHNIFLSMNTKVYYITKEIILSLYY